MSSSLFDVAVDISVTRYVSVAGYAVLVYDTVLTFSEEFQYASRSKNDLAKWALLLNKYLVIAILTLVNMELSGLTGISWTDLFCRSWITAHAVISVISIAISNALVLQRVITLWEHRRIIIKILFTTLFLTMMGSVFAIVILLANLIPYIRYSAFFEFCGVDPSTPTHVIAIPWAIPLLFDLAAIAMTFLNALDRPRNMTTKVADALRQDGLFYFVGLALLRLLNVVLIAVAPTPLLFSAGYFTWAMVTTIMSRFMIRLRRSEHSDGSNAEENNQGVPEDANAIQLHFRTSKGRSLDSYSRSSYDSAYSYTHKREDYWVS